MAKNQKEHIKELEDKLKALEHKDEYNGWTNRESWAMALWLDNEQSTQEATLEKVREIIKGIDNDERVKDKTWSRNEAILFRTADGLKEWLEEMRLDAFEDPANHKEALKMWEDIGSEYRIDWHEVAKHFIQDIQENDEYEKRKEEKASGVQRETKKCRKCGKTIDGGRVLSLCDECIEKARQSQK